MFNFGFSPPQSSSSASGLWFTFFTQGNSVYKQLSEEVKATIEKDAFNPKIIIKLPKLFEVCKGKSKVCWKAIHNSFMYVCEECAIHTSTCYCEECFDLEKHKNHKYTKRKGNGFCNCGSEERWKKQSFCEMHGQYRELQSWTISLENRQKFHKFYSECLRLFFELVNLAYNKKWNIKNDDAMKITVEYGTHLFNNLVELCNNSIDYEQLTYEILMSNYKEDMTFLDTLIDFEVDVFKKNSSNFVASMLSHKKFLMTASEVISKKYKCQKDLRKSQFAVAIYSAMIERSHILNQLAEKDIFVFQESNSQQGVKDIFQFYCFIFTVVKKTHVFSSSVLGPVWNCLLRNNIFRIQLMSKNQLDYILKDVQKQEKILVQILKMIKKTVVEKVNLNNFVSLINNTFRALSKNSDEEDSLQILLKEVQIGEKQIFLISKIYFKQVILKEVEFEEEVILIILKLLDESQNSDLFFEVWSEIANDSENDRILIDFTTHFIRSIIAEQLKCTYQKFKYQKNKQELMVQLEKCFKEFLFMKEIIPQSELLEMKRSKILSFSNAGKILSEMTEYNEFNNEFKYVSNEVHYKPQLCLLKIENHEYIEQLQENPENILREVSKEKIFIFKCIFSRVFQIFVDKMFSSNSELSINIQYYRLLNPIIIQTLLKEQNESIKKYIDNLKEKIGHSSEDDHINKLLNIQKKEQIGKEQVMNEESLEEEGGGESESMKKKKKKKQLLLDKFEKKREKVFENFKQELEHNKKSEEVQVQLCIICKEPQDETKFMYFLGKTKKSAVLNSLFGSSLIANIIMDTCFHPIHIQCFDEYQNNNDTCPLCNQISNCVFPISFNRDEDYYRIWKNIIISIFVRSSMLNVDKMPILLLKNLIMRNGVSSLINHEFREFDKKKIYYFKDLLLKSYQIIGDSGRKSFDEKVQKMKEVIDKNQYELVKKIQSFFLKIYSSIMKKDNNMIIEKDFLELSALLNYKDFNSIKKSVELILDTQLEIEIEKVIFEKEEGGSDLFNIVIPEEANEVCNLVKKCSSCSSERGWYCINCRITFCYECDMINDHKHQIHPQFFILIILHNGRLRFIKRGKSEEYSAYVNHFMENWDGKMDPTDFFLNKRKYNRILNSMLAEE